jgi:hypothetical protein
MMSEENITTTTQVTYNSGESMSNQSAESTLCEHVDSKSVNAVHEYHPTVKYDMNLSKYPSQSVLS